MQNTFLTVENGKIIIDQAQLTMYASVVVIAVVVVVVAVLVLKSRKKNFIKTIPTNLKDGE